VELSLNNKFFLVRAFVEKKLAFEQDRTLDLLNWLYFNYADTLKESFSNSTRCSFLEFRVFLPAGKY